MSTEDRFWAKVDKSGDCWIWMAGRDKKGYGRFWTGGRLVGAHRYAYELVNGPIPDGLHSLHRCDAPACCRPDHIFPGTNADNMADKVEKGRQACGARNGRAKLTEAQAAEIRDLYRMGGITRKEIGERFKVSYATICRVVRGKHWKKEEK